MIAALFVLLSFLYPAVVVMAFRPTSWRPTFRNALILYGFIYFLFTALLWAALIFPGTSYTTGSVHFLTFSIIPLTFFSITAVAWYYSDPKRNTQFPEPAPHTSKP